MIGEVIIKSILGDHATKRQSECDNQHCRRHMSFTRKSDMKFLFPVTVMVPFLESREIRTKLPLQEIIDMYERNEPVREKCEQCKDDSLRSMYRSAKTPFLFYIPFMGMLM